MENVEQVFAKIMEAQKWEKQQLAEYIGVHPSTLSQKLGTHWNAHWRIFVRLLPLMVKLKLISHEELYGTSDNDGHDPSGGSSVNALKSKEKTSRKPTLTQDIMVTLNDVPYILQ